jgi:uncharacterized membrane protein
MHMDFLCILYFIILAIHVSDAICTHHREHKLQRTAVGTRDYYDVLEVGLTTNFQRTISITRS